MGIVLGVLGTLGKILLWLLGIFCVLVLLLLFYPIKYQAQGEWKEGAKAQGRLQWFWFLVRIYVSYEEDFQWKIRLLGFDLMKIMEGNPGGRRKKRRKKSAGTGVGIRNRRQMEGHAGGEGRRESVRIGEEGEGRRESVQSGEGGEGDQKGVRIEGKADAGRIQTGMGEASVPEEPQRDEKVQGRWGERNPFKKWWRKFRHFIIQCKRFFQNLRRKAGFAKDMASLLREDNSRELVCILKDNVLHLWRKLKPKVFRAHLLFGTGNPASTGQILGVFAILYAWYGDGVRIVPDFERKVLEGDFFFRGGISIFTLLLVYFRMFRSHEWECFKKEYDRLTATIHGEF